MTCLRQKMIRELELHRKSPKTIEAYVTAVAQLAQHYGRAPDRISVEEIRDFLHHLITERKLAFSSCNQKLGGIRFFYRHVLGQNDLQLRVPAKRSGRLPEPLSRSEIARLLDATRNAKHRVLLMTAYAAGLRVSELVGLRPQDIHSERKLIRVNQGKGRKDRYTLLSPRLLEELRDYWRAYRPQTWLFPNPRASAPLSVDSVQKVYYAAKERARIEHGHGIHSLRHSFATHLLEAGVNLPTLQRLMGHSRLDTTARYLHITSQHLERLSSPMDLLRLPQLGELVEPTPVADRATAPGPRTAALASSVAAPSLRVQDRTDGTKE
jgi:site-specific recombinase XerD